MLLTRCALEVNITMNPVVGVCGVQYDLPPLINPKQPLNPTSYIHHMETQKHPTPELYAVNP